MLKNFVIIIGIIAMAAVAAPKPVVKTTIKADTTITVKLDTIKTVTYDTTKVTTTLKDTAVVAKVDTAKTKSKPVMIK